MIYLVRHGEAAAGWGDHPDPGLSDLGHKQAAAVADTLLKLGATSLINSPMQRCRETAAPFAAALKATPRVEPAVSEIVTPPGIDDRVSWLRTLMQGQWPADMQGWRRSAYEAVDTLPAQTAVFSHFVAINAIIGEVTGQNQVLVFKPGHCSVTILARDQQGRLALESLGDEAATRIL